MQTGKVQQRGSNRGADLRRLFEAVYKTKESNHESDGLYGEHEVINHDDDDADCCMD